MKLKHMKLNQKGEVALVLLAIGMIWGIIATKFYTVIRDQNKPVSTIK